MSRNQCRFISVLGLALMAILVLATTGLTAPDQTQESWDACYIRGSKIGHIHTWIEKVSDKGREYNRVRLDIEMRLKRNNDESHIKLMYGTIETLDGEVLRLDTRTQAGGDQDIRVHGDVINGQMKLIIKGGGQEQYKVIPWDSDVRGPYGAEQSMAHQPLKEHETRTIKVFIPELNKVSEEKLQARAIEPILLGDGSKRALLRVDQETTVDGKRLPEYDARLYVDAEGQILKSEQDVMGGIVYYRTTRKGALAPGGPLQFDMIQSSVVKVPRKIANPDQTRHVKYRIALKHTAPTDVFPVDARQTLQSQPGDKNAAILEIRSTGPLDGPPVTEAVSDQYLRANALISSDNIRVRTLASRVTQKISDPWEKAKAINAWVGTSIKDKNFKVAFASAAEVARSLEGDCTEHSVLTAAMCRAVGIPSRVVVGLIYVNDLDGFGYHMWDEVFVNNRWVAIDPSWNQTTVDAVHIKLGDTSLDGVAPFEAFLPVATVQGQLTIEPIEIR